MSRHQERYTKWNLTRRECDILDAAIQHENSAAAAESIGYKENSYGTALRNIYGKFRYYEDAPALGRWHVLNMWRKYRTADPVRSFLHRVGTH